MQEPALLTARNLDVSYGRLQVLFGVDLDVHEGERVGLLGTNGAGKSTLLRAVAGLVEPTSGTVTYGTEDVTRLDAEDRVPLGMVLVEGGKAVFPSLSVRENLRLGGYRWLDDEARVRASVDRALDLFPPLRDKLQQAAGTLSGGEQQMVALGRALVAEPRLLMIDELSLGLAPVVLQDIARAVDRLTHEGVTLLLVEQSINVAARLTDRAYFMEKGEIRFEGSTTDLLERGDIARSVFFGADQHVDRTEVRA